MDWPEFDWPKSSLTLRMLALQELCANKRLKFAHGKERSQGQNDADRRCVVQAGSAGSQSDGATWTKSENKQVGDNKPLGALEQRTHLKFESGTVGTNDERPKEAEKMARPSGCEGGARPNAKNGKPAVQPTVDANWAMTRSTGSQRRAVLYFHGCVIATWSRRQSCMALREMDWPRLDVGLDRMHWVQRCWKSGGEPTVPAL